MGSLNIAEWTPDQVAEWMSGLGPKVAQYVPELHKQGLNGAKLLTLRCDDLEYLGIHIIGHQELLLEAVEHLRNFHYEISRECVQQLALRVSSAASALVRTLRNNVDARLETQSLADVARTVHAVKPLVCWLDRWPLCSGSPLAERKAALLKLSLEAATCAQRDRFAEQPARAVAAAAAAVAAVADYIIQDVSDPTILQPASLDAVSLRQGERALGFEVLRSLCGHHQLARLRFASPAHASGLVRDADEIVQVGGKCVIGWSGAAVERACAAAARGAGELQLRLRRRGGRALAALPTPPLRAARRAPRRPPLALHALRLHRYELDVPRAPPPAPAAPPSPAASSSDDSEALSPPASPTLHPDTARLYPPKPAAERARRHSVCGGSPRDTRPPLAVERFWQELQRQRWDHGGSPEPDDSTLYRRDKAVSCSTGLQLSPRPRTCLGVPRPLASERSAPAPVPAPGATPSALCGPASAQSRGKLDKSHSTPAYDFESSEPGVLTSQTIPESPTTPTAPTTPPHCPLKEKAGQILDFKKSSSQIEEAIQLRSRRGHVDDDKVDIFNDEDIRPIDEDSKLEIVETVNVVLSKSVKVTERTVREVRRITRAERKSSPKYSADDTSSDDQIPIPVKYPKPRITERYRPADIPPEPPPRPYVRTRDPPVPPPRESISREAPAHTTPRELSPTTPRELPSPTAAETPPRDPAPSTATPRPTVLTPPTTQVRDVLRARVGDTSPVTPTRSGDNVQSPGRSPEPAIVVGGASEGGVRGMLSTRRGLKKKNSLLLARRGVAARALAAGGAAGGVWQRVRGAGGVARWAARYVLLSHSLLYAFRSPAAQRAACMIYLEGFTVSAAPEVKSKPNAFKVYHTGTAFYFACDTREAMLAWIQLIHRATLLPSLLTEAMELSKQFSETDYSDTESDNESTERRNEKDREREKEREKEKSKFGSLKKLTHRSGRSESQENVSQVTATSLDRKYLRFFSRAKPKDDTKTVKNKTVGAPVPTEHYRSYRREISNPIKISKPTKPTKPTPINYIHASNPNLLDFEKSDFVTKPAIQMPRPAHADKPVGLVTLEQFMLQKQAEENRVGGGATRRGDGGGASGTTAGGGATRRGDGGGTSVGGGASAGGGAVRRGEAGGSAGTSAGGGANMGAGASATSASCEQSESSAVKSERKPAPPAGRRTPAESPQTPPTQAASESAAGGVSRLRLMFGARRDLARQESNRSEPSAQYPHLQCPPTFQPETYSLARPPRPRE